MNPRMTLLAPAVMLALLATPGLGCTDSQTGNQTKPHSAKPTLAQRSPGRTGTVRGRVRWEGAVPRPDTVSIPSGIRKSCGDSVLEPVVDVSPEGGIASVVVWADVPALPASELKGKALPTGVLSQVRCVYQPRILAMTAGSELVVVNEDAVLHNIHARDSQHQTLFNFAQPVQRMQNKKTFQTEGVVQIRCDLHPWMRATVRVFPHQTFTLTDADGRYQLEGVPEGTQKIHYWHPRLSLQSQAVEISDHGPAERDVTWSEVVPK